MATGKGKSEKSSVFQTGIATTPILLDNIAHLGMLNHSEMDDIWCNLVELIFETVAIARLMPNPERNVLFRTNLSHYMLTALQFLLPCSRF